MSDLIQDPMAWPMQSLVIGTATACQSKKCYFYYCMLQGMVMYELLPPSGVFMNLQTINKINSSGKNYGLAYRSLVRGLFTRQELASSSALARRSTLPPLDPARLTIAQRKLFFNKRCRVSTTTAEAAITLATWCSCWYGTRCSATTSPHQATPSSITVLHNYCKTIKYCLPFIWLFSLMA